MCLAAWKRKAKGLTSRVANPRKGTRRLSDLKNEVEKNAALVACEFFLATAFAGFQPLQALAFAGFQPLQALAFAGFQPLQALGFAGFQPLQALALAGFKL